MWSIRLIFCDCGFQSVCPLMDKDKRLMEASWWERLTLGKLGLVLMGRAMFSKSLNQFSMDGWGCVPSLLFDLRPNEGLNVEVTKIMATSFKRPHAHTQCPQPCSRPLPTHASTGNSWTLIGNSGSFSCGVTAPFTWVLVCTRFCLCPLKVCFPSSVQTTAQLHSSHTLAK